MDHPHSLVAIVTLASVLVYLWFGLQVAATHSKTGIHAPAMTGHPDLERAVRVHTNTLEWLPLYLPALWLFAVYWNDLWAASLGVVWILGRLIYAAGYKRDPAKRTPGFLIQALATAVLVFGALGRAAYVYATVGV